jgi:EAL and modified HD-GYP domain-containing signal transduction protein
MHNVYVGRQPIFDAEQRVRAYELLSRSSEENRVHETEGNRATSQVVLNAFVSIGLETMTGGKPAFINCTRDHLLGEMLGTLPREQVVLEILEDVTIDKELIQAVRNHVDAGYSIALDDFVYSRQWDPLIEMASIVKLDVLALDRMQIRRHLRLLRPFDVDLLAEKVETMEEFHRFRDQGFALFQGYFFSRPSVVKGRCMAANRMAVMQLLAHLHDPDADMTELARLIEPDLALTYKLLRYINSPLFSLPVEIRSIRQAIAMLGLNEIRRFASLVLMSNLDDKPPELVNTSLIRARMCQGLAEASSFDDAGTHFIVGLFSNLDAFMDAPMSELVGSLPLPVAARAALESHEGRMGEVLQLVLDCEKFTWDGGERLGLTSEEIERIYLESISWSNQAISGVAGVASE